MRWQSLRKRHRAARCVPEACAAVHGKGASDHPGGGRRHSTAGVHWKGLCACGVNKQRWLSRRLGCQVNANSEGKVAPIFESLFVSLSQCRSLSLAEKKPEQWYWRVTWR